MFKGWHLASESYSNFPGSLLWRATTRLFLTMVEGFNVVDHSIALSMDCLLVLTLFDFFSDDSGLFQFM